MKATLNHTSPRQRVVQYLRQKIGAGDFQPGQRLPVEQELANQLEVSRGTVRAALQELVDSDWVESRRGFGSYVRQDIAVAETAPNRTVCYLVPLCSGRSFLDEILAGVEEVCAHEGLDVSVINLHGNQNSPEEIFERVKRLSPAGVIFASQPLATHYYEVNSRYLDFFEQQSIPYAVVDSPVEREGMIRGNFVGSDGYRAMRQVVRELVEFGHRKIGSIRVFPGVYTSDHRANGIFDQLRKENILADSSLHLTIADTKLENQGRAAIRQLMALDTPPSAVICSHDTLAMNVMDELHKMHYRIPDDISVFGFDDDYFAEFLKLSTVRQPFREIGVRAARMIAEMRSGATVMRRQEFLPCEIIRRASVGIRVTEPDQVYQKIVSL